jgi:hypothetical protein
LKNIKMSNIKKRFGMDSTKHTDGSYTAKCQSTIGQRLLCQALACLKIAMSYLMACCTVTFCSLSFKIVGDTKYSSSDANSVHPDLLVKQPYGPPRPLKGIALLFPYLFLFKGQEIWGLLSGVMEESEILTGVSLKMYQM